MYSPKCRESCSSSAWTALAVLTDENARNSGSITELRFHTRLLVLARLLERRNDDLVLFRCSFTVSENIRKSVSFVKGHDPYSANL
jgi:hypothetical protein